MTKTFLSGNICIGSLCGLALFSFTIIFVIIFVQSVKINLLFRYAECIIESKKIQFDDFKNTRLKFEVNILFNFFYFFFYLFIKIF